MRRTRKRFHKKKFETKKKTDLTDGGKLIKKKPRAGSTLSSIRYGGGENRTQRTEKKKQIPREQK
jgi:hypothetical protein